MVLSWSASLTFSHAQLSLDFIYSRSWAENCNTILPDDAGYALDVRAPYQDTKLFCASLGHKANHSVKQQNCRYANAYHPRFGHISSVVTTKPVKKGEELFVDYLFNEHWDRPWFANE